MASSMLEPAAVEEEEEDNETNALNKNKNNNNNNNNDKNANEKNADDASSSSLHMCANDADFAVICAFFQKFSKDLGLDLPNFKHLQEWFVNTDDVVPQLRDIHIKLLRKAKKTVHDKNWESQLSKYCFTYSAQDAWEIERFGYKKSSLKVKLRILLILLESQFERNVKFRANCMSMSADSLRSQPIGRDRLGHAYYLMQDNDCNLRIYQEHLDEEIWQVVATNREEFVNLIRRLRGNEVVLPSTDIGVIDEDSSSNSCAAVVPKPPPPVERDDSQEDECAKVPTMRIKLNAANGQSCVSNEPTKPKRDVDAETLERHVEAARKNDSIEEKHKSEEDNIFTKDNRRKVKPLIITPTKAIAANTPKKRLIEDVEISPTQQAYKKSRPSLLQSKRVSQKEDDRTTAAAEEEDGEEDREEMDDEGEEEEEEEDFDSEGEDIDSAAADEGDDEDKDIEEDDDDDDDGDGDCHVGESIEEPTFVVRGQGTGKYCQAGNNPLHETKAAEVGEAIEEQVLYVFGEGSGRACLVGNTKNVEEAATTAAAAAEAAESSNKKSTPTTPEGKKATFFFGEPGCLKLSPMKNSENQVKKFSLFGSWLEENKHQTNEEEEQEKQNDDKNEKNQETRTTQHELVETNENLSEKVAACTNKNRIENAEKNEEITEIAPSEDNTKINGDAKENAGSTHEETKDNVSIALEKSNMSDNQKETKLDNEIKAEMQELIDDEGNNEVEEKDEENLTNICKDEIKTTAEKDYKINKQEAPSSSLNEIISDKENKIEEQTTGGDQSVLEINTADSVEKEEPTIKETNKEEEEEIVLEKTMTNNEQIRNYVEGSLDELTLTEKDNKTIEEPIESINKSPLDLNQNSCVNAEFKEKEEEENVNENERDMELVESANAAEIIESSVEALKTTGNSEIEENSQLKKTPIEKAAEEPIVKQEESEPTKEEILIKEQNVDSPIKEEKSKKEKQKDELTNEQNTITNIQEEEEESNFEEEKEEAKCINVESNNFASNIQEEEEPNFEEEKEKLTSEQNIAINIQEKEKEAKCINVKNSARNIQEEEFNIEEEEKIIVKNSASNIQEKEEEKIIVKNSASNIQEEEEQESNFEVEEKVIVENSASNIQGEEESNFEEEKEKLASEQNIATNIHEKEELNIEEKEEAKCINVENSASKIQEEDFNIQEEEKIIVENTASNIQDKEEEKEKIIVEKSVSNIQEQEEQESNFEEEEKIIVKNSAINVQEEEEQESNFEEKEKFTYEKNSATNIQEDLNIEEEKVDEFNIQEEKCISVQNISNIQEEEEKRVESNFKEEKVPIPVKDDEEKDELEVIKEPQTVQEEEPLKQHELAQEVLITKDEQSKEEEEKEQKSYKIVDKTIIPEDKAIANKKLCLLQNSKNNTAESNNSDPHIENQLTNELNDDLNHVSSSTTVPDVKYSSQEDAMENLLITRNVENTSSLMKLDENQANLTSEEIQSTETSYFKASVNLNVLQKDAIDHSPVTTSSSEFEIPVVSSSPQPAVPEMEIIAVQKNFEQCAEKNNSSPQTAEKSEESEVYAETSQKEIKINQEPIEDASPEKEEEELKHVQSTLEEQQNKNSKAESDEPSARDAANEFENSVEPSEKDVEFLHKPNEELAVESPVDELKTLQIILEEQQSKRTDDEEKSLKATENETQFVQKPFEQLSTKDADLCLKSTLAESDDKALERDESNVSDNTLKEEEEEKVKPVESPLATDVHLKSPETDLKSLHITVEEQHSKNIDLSNEGDEPFERDEPIKSDNSVKSPEKEVQFFPTPTEELAVSDIESKSFQITVEEQYSTNINTNEESNNFVKSPKTEVKLDQISTQEVFAKESPFQFKPTEDTLKSSQMSFEESELKKTTSAVLDEPSVRDEFPNSAEEISTKATDFDLKSHESKLTPYQEAALNNQYLKNIDTAAEPDEPFLPDESTESVYLAKSAETNLEKNSKINDSFSATVLESGESNNCIESLEKAKDTEFSTKSAVRELKPIEISLEQQHAQKPDEHLETDEPSLADNYVKSPINEVKAQETLAELSQINSNFGLTSPDKQVNPIEEASLERAPTAFESTLARQLVPNIASPIELHESLQRNELTESDELKSTVVQKCPKKVMQKNMDVSLKFPEMSIITIPSNNETTEVVLRSATSSAAVKSLEKETEQLTKIVQGQIVHTANVLELPVAVLDDNFPVLEKQTTMQESNPSTPLDLAFTTVRKEMSISSVPSAVQTENPTADTNACHASGPLNLTALSTDLKEPHDACAIEQSHLSAAFQPSSVFQPFNFETIYSGKTNNAGDNIAIPLASASPADKQQTQASANIIPNRKRRLADHGSHVLARTQSTSDSELDLHTQQFEPTVDSDLEEGDVGGKRIKMRPKQANIELRKKFEAQKIPVDEATSSSGEEEARRRRKIISPKRNPKKPSSFFTNKDCEKSPEATTSKLSRQSSIELVQPPTLEKTAEVSRKFAAPIKLAGSKPKPTLAEIIEKKLRKPTVTTQLNTMTTDTAESSAEISTHIILPPKKMPITKPLKKNLLTQLRHNDSDDEPIPRKRTISEVMAEAACLELAVKADEQIQNISTNLLRQRTPDRIMSERHRKRRSSDEMRSSTESAAAQYDDASEVILEKHKRNNDDLPVKLVELTRDMVMDAQNPMSRQAVFEEMKTDNSISDVKEVLDLKKETLPLATSPTNITTVEPIVGRRSGRRGGAAVVYSELPQVKRTRSGVAKEKKDSNNGSTEQITDGVMVKHEISPQNKKDTKKAKKEILKDKDMKEPQSAENESQQKRAKEQDFKESKDKEEALNDVRKNIEGKREKQESQEKVAKEKNSRESVDKEEVFKDVKIDLAAEKAAEVMESSISAQINKTTENENKTILEDSSKDKSPTATASNNDTPTARGRGGRKKREVDTSNIIEATDSETPVRQSRRIAQLKIREEAERRKLEEIALRNMKQEFKKKKKAELDFDPAVAEPSEHSSSEESAVESKRKVKKKCPGKDGGWSSGSEEQEEPEEEEEPAHYETDPGSPLFRSDHEFSPESDIEDESQVVPMKRARTARNEDCDEYDEKTDEQACQNCGKSDHPEWILLCDKCDKGYHCSCLSPVLFYIPEGDWYCPPCQQAELIIALEQRLNIYDEDIERKRLAAEEEKRKAQEAQLAESERLLEEEKFRKERREHKKNHNSSSDEENVEKRKSTKQRDSKDSGSDDDEDEKCLAKLKHARGVDKSKRRRAEAKNRNRRAARRGNRSRRRRVSLSQDASDSASSDSRGSANSSKSSGTDSSEANDSDDEPIYKLRKRRQINVSYRLNEYDEIINSALKKEMAEVAGAGNLGRGKDITTIIEADKEEKARQKHNESGEEEREEPDQKVAAEEVKNDKVQENDLVEVKEKATMVEENQEKTEKTEIKEDSDSDDAPIIRRKSKGKGNSKKSRKLTTLDISSEEDHASDEDFKTSSLEDEEDEDTTFSGSSESDSSLEIYKRKAGKHKERRRAARERRKDRKFIYDESDDDEQPIVKPKKKRKVDTDYEESEDDDEDASENSENVDSADLCDDTTSESSDDAWRPTNKKKTKKSKSNTIARKYPKLKKPIISKKKKRTTEYSDDDISESEEEEEDDDYYNGVSGKGSGKQPRSQPLKTSATSKECNKGVGKGKGKGKGKTTPSGKSESKQSGEESFSDSGDSARRTRGRRYAYLEDFDDDSSDGGIKPGVKRPDTPPEEREKFIKRQEEIKRMLAEKNAEGAKLAATPRLTPIKGTTAEKRTPSKATDSLSTVPLSVIRQAKVLDKDYLQRIGEPIGDLETANADEEVDGPEFDDADLPYDFPEDMDEDAIARMVEEEDFAAASRELPPADEVVRSSVKSRYKMHAAAVVASGAEVEKSSIPSASASLAAMAQIPNVSTSGLQEPVRKRLPMPTMHPPLLRHQPVSVAAIHQNISAAAVAAAAAQILTRHPSPPSYLLQSALTSPLGQPLNRNFPSSRGMPQMLVGRPPAAHVPMLQTAEAQPKPRGRRKKITPLRDALQKQQTAAAASSAPTTVVSTPTVTTTAPKTNSRSQVLPSSIPVGGVIKSAISSSISSATPTSSASLSIAQPPQLYKRAGDMPLEGQPSVITRMPLLPPHATPPPASSRHQHGRPPPVSVAGQLPPTSIFQSVADVARFYAPQQSFPPGARSLPSSMVTQRMPRGAHPGPGGLPLQLSGLPPHHSMRPTYGPPPPLRGSVGGPLPNHGQPPTTGAAGVTRSPYASVTQAGESPAHGAYALPPPARHATAHLNPYRPTIYGNPNFAPRAPFSASNLRHAGPPGGPEFTSSGRPYPPYAYYPAPPPLTTPSQQQQHQQQQQQQQHSTSQSNSSAGGAPTPSALPSSVIVSAPPSAERVAAALNAPSINHVSTIISRTSTVKSPTVTTHHNQKQPSVLVDSRRKLTTLDVYSTIKSPLTMGGESSGSRSSPGGEEGHATPTAHSTVISTNAGVESKASEFSGLVSYFSSQHDDYNT